MVLAQGLDPAGFEVIFARPASFAWLTKDVNFRAVDLDCQDSRIFARRLDRGLPLYGFDTLAHYVEADLALIDAYRPEVVVGDFRLSLSVSARLRSVQYITLCDAYWSPEQPLQPALPVLGFTRFVPLELAEAGFRAVAPLAFRLHARPMERLRACYGLPSLGHDLRRCYTDSDLRLFANFPALFPQIKPSPQADFIGPIAWSPPDRAGLVYPEGDGPMAYVTMGSSGDPRVLATLIPVLEQAGVRVMLASAGRVLPAGIGSKQTRVHDFLPGDQLCRQADLVICNGGSPTTNQALAHSVPVLGIARNMDQFLNMRAIERYGAGMTIRSDRADRHVLTEAVERLLNDGHYRENARALAQSSSPVFSLQSQIDTLLHG